MAIQKEITEFQHYVPQTWLRRFTYNKGKSSLFVFDTENDATIGSKNIKHIAGEKYFYDFHPTVFNELVKNNIIDPIKEPQIVEKQFLANNIEDKLGKVLKKTIETLESANVGEKVLNEKLKLTLTIHFSIQYFRGVSVRKITNDILKIMEDMSQNDERYKEFEVIAEEQKEFMHFLLMKESNPLFHFANNIFTRPWVIFKAPVGESFVISDDPFVTHRHEGLDDICIPISKEYIVVIYNEQLPRVFDLAFIELNKTLKFSVGDFNLLQYQQAFKQIYSYTDDFSWINKSFKKGSSNMGLRGFSETDLKKRIIRIMDNNMSEES